MTLFKLFFEFFKIGLFTFGGGQAMIPLIRDAVLANSWLKESEFYDFIGICESTPGPIAVNMATYVGAQNGGFLGSVCATLGVVLPSFIIILLIAAFLKSFSENKYVNGFLKGVNPVIIALISSTGLILLAKSLGYVSLKRFDFNLSAAVCFAAICAVYFTYKKLRKKKISSVALILVSAVLGLAVTPLINSVK